MYLDNVSGKTTLKLSLRAYLPTLDWLAAEIKVGSIEVRKEEPCLPAASESYLYFAEVLDVA